MAKQFDICIESGLPVVQQNGLNTNKSIYAVESPACDLPAATTIGGSTVTALGYVTSASANALGAGLNGTTNPAFNVDASTALSATGINIKSAAAAGGVALSVSSSGIAENLTVDAKGTGTVTIAGTSTGAVTITPATTVTGVLTNPGGYTSTAGIALKSGTAVPATAGAIAAGAPITLFSGGNKIWITSDVPSHTATKGDLCINTGGSSSSTRMYINNGTTNWVAVTTAS